MIQISSVRGGGIKTLHWLSEVDGRIEPLHIEDWAEFIREAYRTILKREPDEDGFSHRHKQLSDGVDCETMIAQLTWAREQKHVPSDRLLRIGDRQSSSEKPTVRS